ncbi:MULTISPECIES: hypothetical protein [Paenibacillus]|nr:hypothetical protein [Paenibacillus amylolyticus]WFA83871.1 hypothetical protein OGI70_23185 [Paenibacillus amylolyticus]
MLVHDIQPNNPWSLYTIMVNMPVNAEKKKETVSTVSFFFNI